MTEASESAPIPEPRLQTPASEQQAPEISEIPEVPEFLGIVESTGFLGFLGSLGFLGNPRIPGKLQGSKGS